MNRTLRQWIIDTVAADMRSSYRRAQTLPFEYDFIGRYADFYVNMLTRIFNILDGEYYDNYDVERQKAELLNLAHGMEIFNERWKQSKFAGINRNDNALYVAVIYYLCDYEAVAAMYIRDCRLADLRTDAARTIFYIISGGGTKGNEIENHGINTWLTTGDHTSLSKFKALLEERAVQMSFDSADDFFDSQLLLHVLKKFREDNIRTDLYTFDNSVSWNRYLEYSFRKHIFSFLPSQREALRMGLLSFNRAFSLRMPTSAGKSYITELVIYQELQKTSNAKILYLAPLRSLGHELREKYRKISRQLGFTYRSLYGGSSMTGTEAILAEADLFITTPETFMSLEGAIDDILRQFTLVICDEGQLIESIGRGLDYEMLLSRLRKQEHIRFLFISAIIPNIGDINTWLGGTEEEVGESSYRPCKIRFGVANSDKARINLKVYENINNRALFDFTSFVNKEECKGFKLDTQRNKACLMAMKALDAGSVMLYSTFKKGNSSCRKYGEYISKIIQKGKLPPPRSFLKASQHNLLDVLYEFTEYNFGIDYYETNFLKEGFAVHTASLPQELREIVEIGLEKGALRMIICNSTLAEGVNFPIKTLVLGDIRHPLGKGLMEREVLMNVIGRVGRAGRETYVFIICVEDKWRFVKEAASGENLKHVKGMLNDIASEILKVERKLHRQLTDEEVNKLLSENGLTESIDKMLMLSTDDFTANKDVPEEVSKSSLSYHLGSDKHRKLISRIFSVRSNYLHGVSYDNVRMYKDAQIPPHVQAILQTVITDDCGLPTLAIEDLSSDEWIEKVVSFTSTSLLVQIDDKAKVKTLLSYWMAGLRYVEIAYKMRISIDDVVEQIEWLRRDFLLASKSILRYISIRFNIQSDVITNWAYLVEKGLNSKMQIMMMQKGLYDRSALHAIDRHIFNNTQMTEDKNVLHDFLYCRKDEVIDALEKEGLPVLSLNHIVEFLS